MIIVVLTEKVHNIISRISADYFLISQIFKMTVCVKFPWIDVETKSGPEPLQIRFRADAVFFPKSVCYYSYNK